MKTIAGKRCETNQKPTLGNWIAGLVCENIYPENEHQVADLARVQQKKLLTYEKLAIAVAAASLLASCSRCLLDTIDYGAQEERDRLVAFRVPRKEALRNRHSD